MKNLSRVVWSEGMYLGPHHFQSAQPMRLANGKTLTLPFELDLKGAPPIFQKGYLSGFECVSEIAR